MNKSSPLFSNPTMSFGDAASKCIAVTLAALIAGCAAAPSGKDAHQKTKSEWLSQVTPYTSEFEKTIKYPMPKLEMGYEDGTVVYARLIATKDKNTKEVTKALFVEVTYDYAQSARFYDHINFIGGEALAAVSKEQKVVSCTGRTCYYMESLIFLVNLNAEKTKVKFTRFQLMANDAKSSNVIFPNSYIAAFNQIAENIAESH